MKPMATDVGGTFTDIVWVDTETDEVLADKSPTTPRDVVQGGARSNPKVPSAEIGQFVHGSTVATNALIVMGGAQTGLITTVISRFARNPPDQLTGRPHLQHLLEETRPAHSSRMET